MARVKSWFTVCVRIAIQVAGRSRGKQTVEDRVILLRATNEDAAKRQALKVCRSDEKPYEGGEGRLVRWHCEGIVEVQELLDAEIDPSGTEVFTIHSERTIRPQDVWRPSPRRAAQPTTSSRPRRARTA